jgi:hypothetical protein
MIIFFTGFDFFGNGSFGPGGRVFDQASTGAVQAGRFGGQCLQTSGNGIHDHGTMKTLGTNVAEMITGFAMNVGGYISSFGGTEFPSHPFFTFYDGSTPQASLWINPTTQFLEVRTGRGDGVGPNIVLTTAFVPPLTLWYYLECKINFSTGDVELVVDGASIGTANGILQQSGHGYANKIEFTAFNSFFGGVTGGQWQADDFYLIDTSQPGANDYLGEVRVQTKYPDADGNENDFLRSTGLINASNVNTVPVTYSDNGKFNFSGTVGAIDLYSIQNFTVSGTIFAVQENMAFKKDDVGNRQVAPIVRTASTNYVGPSVSCFSSYTNTSHIWEKNPNTSAAWALIDLNLAEFGIKVTS